MNGIAGHHTALYTKRRLRGSKDFHSVDSKIRDALNAGFPKEKLNVGLALFGRTYKLTASSQNKLGSSISTYGSPGNVL